MKKYQFLIGDVVFEKKHTPDGKNILNLDKIKTGLSALDLNLCSTLVFWSIYDFESKYYYKSKFNGKLMLSTKFNQRTNFSFEKYFPLVKTIIVQDKLLQQHLNQKYKNKIKIIYKEEEINYC